ncbi:MAG TPA: T9SS type A sorting domain-containing protein, partial [Bacteroidales bacterium]|nr:T9SS type A sorting domain-containing protein [Bacteroidales bacterium]
SGDARYGNNSNCGWIISPTSQPASIVLTVEYLALEEEIDYVIIYEGTSNSGNVIAALTGHTLPSPATYYIFSPNVYIEFTSNESLRDDGFRITYQSGNNINDVANSNLSVYPNPATDIIVVETPENINNVKIFNSLGQNVLNQNFQNQNKIQLNIENIIPGLYIIETSLDNGLKLRKTINIQ